MAHAMAASKHPPTGELDEVTLRRAQRGDRDAFRRLVSTYEGLVFAFLSRSLGGAEQVEDVAQETFLDVFRALHRFSPSGPARLSTWILTIASRRAIDARRRQPPAGIPLDEELHEAAERADHGARRAAVVAVVGRALDELAPDFRVAFVLNAFHGFDYREIAVALDIEVGTVKSRIARARARLGRRLEEVLS